MLTQQEVEHIAKLARLQLTQQEQKMYGEQMSSILAYVQKLQELNTDGVEEFMHAASGSNVFREDIAQRCDSSIEKNIIESFPHRVGNLLEVEAIFDQEKDTSYGHYTTEPS